MTFSLFFHIFLTLRICLFFFYVIFGAERINWNEKKCEVTMLDFERHLIPSTKLTFSSHKTFHLSYMKFLDEMLIKVNVSSIFKEKNNSGYRMSKIRTRSIGSGVHHSNPYTTEDLVTNTSLI